MYNNNFTQAREELLKAFGLASNDQANVDNK